MLVPFPDKGNRSHHFQHRRLAILGSTGSIGCSALELVRNYPDRFSLHTLVANRSVELFYKQILEFKPKYAVLADSDAYMELKKAGNLPSESEILSGPEVISELVVEKELDLVLGAIVGMAGLSSSLAAVKAGKILALANKESLVAAGALFHEAMQATPSALLIPVDSEHSAIFQALHGEKLPDLNEIILTASGGPFLNHSLEELRKVSPAEAAAHPRWSMGAKVSIDSASLINKALELIEAAWLFGVDPDRISVLVHPQSIIHSLIKLCDGTQMAQLSIPDMKGPIAYALNYPDGRLSSVMNELNLAEMEQLSFSALDNHRFPAVELARKCLRSDMMPRAEQSTSTTKRFGAACFVFNLANELAVEAFRAEKIAFTEIVPYIDRALEQFASSTFTTLEELNRLSLEIKAAF